jgi:hypothetical protein
VTPDIAPGVAPDAPADAPADAEDASDAGVDAPCGEGGPVGEFDDDFSQGARPAYWTIDQTSPDAGVYTYADDAGALHFAKVGTNPGGQQHIAATLDMAAVGGPVQGDFTMTVDFHDAVLGAVGSGIDQIELHANFEDTTYFFDVYTNENGLEFHVWDGAFHTGFDTTVDAATLQIVRTGSTLTAYALTAGDGGDAGAQVVFSKTGTTSALTSASFILQNYNTNNAISVTYDNFSLRGACVHP